jgi:hypothetical protein
MADRKGGEAFWTERHFVMAITSAREHWAQCPPLTKGGTTMLAEIFMLRLQATARAAKEAATITRSTSPFVPITLPPVKAS